MDTSRLLRTSGTLLATAALLLSGVAAQATVRPQGEGDGSSAGLPPDPAAGAQRPVLSGVPAAAPLLAPLPARVPAALRRYYGQKPSWHACTGAKGAGFECATLKAPLDYGRPRSGGDVRLAVARKRATGPGGRLGSLMVNPGGPGGSAVGFLQQYAGSGYPAAVRARYDIVAMDPRGVAGSEPISCLTDAEMDAYAQVDQTPDNDTEVRQLVASYKKFAHGCASRSARLLSHVSTIDAARDMDIFRAALGDEKVHYIGASYGTFLGATYAGLYPSRVGRLVLDGALDPSLDAGQVNRDQTTGFQTAFASFAKDCAAHEECPLGSDNVTDAGNTLKRFFRDLDHHPLATGTPRQLTESLATTGVIAAMYDEAAWPVLRKALRDAQTGDGALLLKLSDIYYERDQHGHYANLMAANSAVNCLDLPPAYRGPAAVRRALPEFEKASPAFGESFAWGSLSCAYWPVHSTGTPHRIPARGAAPILVIGTTRDPATPYPWARSLASQLSSGRLLTYDGDGHTAYTRGSTCIDTAVNDYLLTTTPPPASRRCS